MWVYHVISLQQLENGPVELGDEVKKLELGEHWYVTLYIATKPMRLSPQQTTRKKTGKEAAGKPAMAKPEIRARVRACVEFNGGKCNVLQAEHTTWLHICLYCLSVARQQRSHQEHFCCRKIYGEDSKNDKATKN